MILNLLVIITGVSNGDPQIFFSESSERSKRRKTNIRRGGIDLCYTNEIAGVRVCSYIKNRESSHKKSLKSRDM